MIGQSRKFFSVKTGFEKLKKINKICLKKYLVIFGGSDAMNELLIKLILLI